MDKLKVVDAAWHGMKGAWGMAKDQLTGDSGDDQYDPKLSPLQAFTNSSKLTANQSVDHLEAFVESMATLGGMSSSRRTRTRSRRSRAAAAASGATAATTRSRSRFPRAREFEMKRSGRS